MSVQRKENKDSNARNVVVMVVNLSFIALQYYITVKHSTVIKYVMCTLFYVLV